MGFYKSWIIESLYLTLISEKHQRQKKVPDKFDLIFYGYISKMNQYTKKKYGLNKTCQFVAQIMSHFLLFISQSLSFKHKAQVLNLSIISLLNILMIVSYFISFYMWVEFQNKIQASTDQ